MRVLDRDRGVVDQDADRKRQAAKRHGVQRVAEEIERDQRREDGERNRDHDDQVDRQEPRNSRIISAVRAPAITPSRTTLSTELVTKVD